jgi:hypothetical protein
MSVERLLHDPALNTLAASVNQSHLTKPSLVGGGYVLLDHGRDISWRKRVEVERVFDRNPHGWELAVWELGVYEPALYEAVTTVFMPPRIAKSPTTIMRRGSQAATRSSRIWLVAASKNTPRLRYSNM